MATIDIDWSAEVRHHHTRVVAFLVRKGMATDRAEELAQEAWAKLIEQNQRGRFDRIVLPGLVFAQARFLALDEVRRAAFIATKPPTDSTTPDPGNAEERFLDRDALRRAHAALDACPPRAREVFRHVQAHPADSHAVAAAELGLSVQRVRQVLCEVRGRLRAAIG